MYLIMFHILFLVVLLTSNHVICETIDLIQRLKESELIPEVIRRPPKHILSVTYGDIKIEPGQIVNLSLVKEKPDVFWHANESDLYCLYMTGASKTFLFRYSNPPTPTMYPYVRVPFRFHWLQWAIGNIPGNKLKDGDVLREYISPHFPEPDVVHEYLFLIFKQLGRINYTDLKTITGYGFEFAHIAAFRKHYNITRPTYGNFFVLKGVPRPTTEPFDAYYTTFEYPHDAQKHLDMSAEYRRKHGNKTYIDLSSAYFDD